jgi:hypothetical protein
MRDRVSGAGVLRFRRAGNALRRGNAAETVLPNNAGVKRIRLPLPKTRIHMNVAIRILPRHNDREHNESAPTAHCPPGPHSMSVRTNGSRDRCTCKQPISPDASSGLPPTDGQALVSRHPEVRSRIQRSTFGKSPLHSKNGTPCPQQL